LHSAFPQVSTPLIPVGWQTDNGKNLPDPPEARFRRRIESYRNDLISTVRDVGEQRALWDRDWADTALEQLERLAADGADFTADDLVAEVGQPTARTRSVLLFLVPTAPIGPQNCMGHAYQAREATDVQFGPIKLGAYFAERAT
jgi:hypothetical protein